MKAMGRTPKAPPAARAALLQLAQLTSHGLNRSAHTPEMAQYAVARWRQLLATPHALKQTLAQSRLQFLNHFGSGWLRHAQLA